MTVPQVMQPNLIKKVEHLIQVLTWVKEEVKDHLMKADIDCFHFVKWNGGKINQGETVDQMTSVLDIFPTLMDLCKVNFSKTFRLRWCFIQTGAIR